MSQRRSFYRKVAYAVAIVVLIPPLVWLSLPSISAESAPDGQAVPGGKLAQLRDEYKLGQANLGEIDPASETMKFATLGLRGVATMMWWGKANEYKMKEDWTNFSAALDQIIKLEPHYIEVWRHQAWNVSYNLSVEFDDYRDRYHYVMRGIKFLERGLKYNEDHPLLFSELGWFIGNKIGKADEHREFRRLFRQDEDYQPADRVGEARDNWLVGREWYLDGYRAVLEKGKPLKTPDGRGKSELIFYSHAPMCLMNYAEAIEEEGRFGNLAEQAWIRAGLRWCIEKTNAVLGPALGPAYGYRGIKHSTGLRFHLNDYEDVQAEAERLAQRLDALEPGLREKIKQERVDALTDKQRQALETPLVERNEEQYELAGEAESATYVRHMDVALRIEQEMPEKGKEAIRLARDAEKTDLKVHKISSYRGIINFNYWRTRTEYERTADALAARQLIFEADQKLQEANLVEAQRLYEQAFGHWRSVLDRYPEIAEHGVTGDELLDVVKHYRRTLEENDQPFPRDFPLWDIIEMHDQPGDFRDLLEVHKAQEKAEKDAAKDEPGKTKEATAP